MLFISLHDRNTEGEFQYDMRWLHDSDITFTAGVNQSSPDSAVAQLISRGQFRDGITIWNPTEDGKVFSLLKPMKTLYTSHQ